MTKHNTNDAPQPGADADLPGCIAGCWLALMSLSLPAALVICTVLVVVMMMLGVL